MRIAENWTDVTIKMYQELNSVDRENDLTNIIERIAILADCDPEDIRQLPIPEFKKLSESIGWVTEKPNPDIRTKLEIDGKKYGIIPDLSFISTGEWADIENWKDDSINNLHFICALIYRPITKEVGDEYEIEPHKPQGFMRRAELFLNRLSIETVFGAVLFFSASGIQFIEIIADYLEAEAKAMKPKKKRTKKTTPQKASKKSK